eukprot:351652-Chlamydomonas_euryale.AAC.3
MAVRSIVREVAVNFAIASSADRNIYTDACRFGCRRGTSREIGHGAAAAVALVGSTLLRQALGWAASAHCSLSLPAKMRRVGHDIVCANDAQKNSLLKASTRGRVIPAKPSGRGQQEKPWSRSSFRTGRARGAARSAPPRFVGR